MMILLMERTRNWYYRWCPNMATKKVQSASQHVYANNYYYIEGE
jgi:hypothetical protein